MGPFARLLISEIIKDYIAVRRETLMLFPQSGRIRLDTPRHDNKNKVTVRALACIIGGHELHHRRILEEKYSTR